MPRLRRATDTDSGGVIALIARVFAEYEGCVLDVEAEEPELRAPASSFDRFWVLERSGEVVGCAACVPREDHLELKKVYLDRELRGRGWGRKLIEQVEQRARELGLPRIEFWSDTRFETAHAAYLRLGYRPTGRTRDLHDLSNTTEYHFLKRTPYASDPPQA
ncbi:MAG: GNAT family N-acetyltransferase [Planctomycetota bacterium]|jgi:putative acetyltransferase